MESLRPFHGKAIALDIEDRLAPFPALFVINEQRLAVIDPDDAWYDASSVFHPVSGDVPSNICCSAPEQRCVCTDPRCDARLAVVEDLHPGEHELGWDCRGKHRKVPAGDERFRPQGWMFARTRTSQDVQMR
ncbi:hypothetical protein BD626DRAFT_482927 [Schizophyllum amplum]|uniref:Uncharacterized protein n=1 Tax=Schizophyllum amplum TaxID=97359 RepID=A0A550CP45_9AGAR|nr:hypothetical protein BD626DRAFT_482927 [Auriculariopsis ampla]